MAAPPHHGPFFDRIDGDFGAIHKPDAGQVLIAGVPHDPRPAGFGERQKVAFVHQDLGLVEWMTVAENIALALGLKHRGGLIE